MSIIRNCLHIIKLLYQLNIIKTLYFNIRMFPLLQALRFPVFLYGKVYLWDLSGQIILPEKIFSGMIKIGYRWHDLWPIGFLPSQVQVRGKLVFSGRCLISGGTNINVQHKDAVLKLGDSTVIGAGSILKCLQYIEIGDSTGLTGNCTILDCNMHFVKNIQTGAIQNYKGPIKIGKKCWLNYGTIVSKGSIIPDYSITAKNSFVSKDFSNYGTNLFLVGAPCKPKTTKVQRIFSDEKQGEYKEYYERNDEILTLQPGIEPDEGVREGFK